MQKRIIMALALGCGLARTMAAEPAAAAPPKKWESSAAAGLTLTSGNSDTFMATVSLDTKRKWEKDEAAFGVAGGYGESELNGVDEETAEFIRGFGQWNHLFTERLYGGFRLDGEYDGIAGVEYRFRFSPLLGYYLIKNDKMSLAVEAGPTYVMEKLEGYESDDYLAARFAERFDYKLSQTTKLWQSLEYLPDVENWADKYLINAEIGIDTAITKSLSLRVVFQDNYVSEPAAGREKNDIRLLAGLGYKF